MFVPKKEKRKICEVMGVLVNWTEGIPSQCVCISNHHDVHFKYPTILFVNYTLIQQKI